MRILILAMLLIGPLVTCADGKEPFAFSTFTAMAVDRERGRIGVATASGYPFDVLARVAFATSGDAQEPAHIVVSQAIGNPEHWNIGRQLAAGAAPQAALDMLLADDEQAAFRQVAVCAAGSPPVAYTGKSCGSFAGHRIDAERGLVVMGNALDGPEVLEAMIESLRSTKGPLPERLIAALQAGDAAGGEVRPLLSAGYCLVRLEASGNRGRDRAVTVAVCRDRDPLAELARHVDRRRSVQLLEAGIAQCNDGSLAAGIALLERAVELDPHSPEAHLWLGYYRFEHSDGMAGFNALARAESLYAARLESDDAARATIEQMLQKWGDPATVGPLLQPN